MSFYNKAETIYNQDSPTVYQFCNTVLDSKSNIVLEKSNQLRQCSKTNNQRINISGIGEKSKALVNNKRTISQIVKNASSSQYKCELLVKMAKWCNARKVLELGTNLGIATCAFAENELNVTSVEGNEELFQYAKKNVADKMNIQLVNDLFSSFLKNNIEKYNLILIDGDHSYEATRHLVEKCKIHLQPEGIIIIDDIRWSSGMKKAWQEILEDGEFNFFIDLFMLGVISKKSHLKTTIFKKLLPKKYKPWPYHFFRK